MFVIDDDKTLDNALIQKYINSFICNDKPKLLNWYNYYIGNHKILNKTYSDESKPCSRIVTNFCKTIVNTYAGYIAGKPINYISSNDITEVQNVINYNDSSSEDMIFLTNALIFGVAYELHYLDEEANQRYAQISPLNSFPIYNNKLNREIKYFIRWYPINEIDNSNEYIVEIYDEYNISTYKMYGQNGGVEFIKQDRHYFNDVPVSVFVLNDNEESVFNCIITLNDAYNELQSCEIDDFSSWCDAYLCLTNMDNTDSNDIANMKTNRVLLIPDNGKAEWLTKNSNDTQINNMLENIKKNIYKITATPDMGDQDFLAQSGTALAYKLVGFENTASGIVANMVKAIQRRIELICNILQLKANDTIWRDIRINFTRNLPSNLTESAQVVNTLRGVVSTQTLLSLLPFVSDPVAEMKLVEEENNKNADIFNFKDTNSSENKAGTENTEDITNDISNMVE